VSYDERAVQYYFGEVIKSTWRRDYSTIADLLLAAEVHYDYIVSVTDAFDDSLLANTTMKFGTHYARIASLAYRQTFAAIESGWSEKFNESWYFLKEISSDGDINTMDVIFPASPVLFMMDPSIVKQLLLPVLHYGNNETWHNYSYPFSPHQLGTYPVANITTIEQEVMPAENTGNMFLLLLQYVKLTEAKDLDWVYPRFWGLLQGWAMYLIESQLPVPPRQTCTDDFAGPLAQNTNLAAKCIIALEAFAEVCDILESRYGNQSSNGVLPSPWNCGVYRTLATAYAEFWVDFAVETDTKLQLNHSRLAFNLPGTWSTKYNLLWQKMLRLERPFTTFPQLAADEVAYYKAKSHRFGFPMDVRHTYQKLDWMTWGSCLAANASEFASLFEGIYLMANDTTSRWPLTDLFDTVTADIYLSFRSRPVVGAIFAAMLLY
jgi:hypothetical protein